MNQNLGMSAAPPVPRSAGSGERRAADCAVPRLFASLDTTRKDTEA